MRRARAAAPTGCTGWSQPIEPQANPAALAECARRRRFRRISARAWEAPQLHAVFTAHPTFLLAPAQTEAVAARASRRRIDQRLRREPANARRSPCPTNTREAMTAIANAQDARDRIVGAPARQRRTSAGPSEWHELCSAAVPLRQLGRLRHGRADRHQVVHFDRLPPVGKGRAAGSAMSPRSKRSTPSIRCSANCARRPAMPPTGRQDFAADLSDPAALSVAANRLTANDPRKLLSPRPVHRRARNRGDEAARRNARSR